MDLAKRYEDSDGNECSILQMVAREPEWAANRLQVGEKAIKELQALRSGIAAVIDLMDHSEGVAGLHLNGDVATWDSLRKGGHFEEWLRDLDEAAKLLGNGNGAS